MTTDIDHILDRRGLRKKISFWRIIAILAFALALLATLYAAGLFKNIGSQGDHIARIPITGMITEDRKLLKLIKKAEDDEKVKGVVLAINSPGGTTVGGEAIFHAVRSLAEKKPVVSSVGTLAASAGYMIASASDHIVARHSSIVGSIGVIVQFPQASELLAKIGVEMKEVKSSPLKAEPSPFHPAPPESIAMLKRLVDDSYNWFIDLVADRRPLSREEVRRLADGSVYSGNQGLKFKLVDALGGEEKAKEWLVKTKGLDEKLELVDWKVKSSSSNLLLGSILNRWLFDAKSTPLDGVDPNSLPAIVPRRLFLDGLLSVWHG